MKPGDGIVFLNYGLETRGVIRAINQHPGRGATRPDTLTVFVPEWGRKIELPITCRFMLITALKPALSIVMADCTWQARQCEAEAENRRYIGE